MYLWNLVEPGKLVRTEAPLPKPQEGFVRVRVTKVFLNSQDAAIYAGAIRVRYPIVPGRFAVGFVSDETNPLFPKGTRVLLHGYRPVPRNGTEKRDFSAADYYACGRTTDGFLSDFVLVAPTDMTALPSSVSDERALLLHQVAAAKEISDRLGVQRGRHVAVIGADLMGILLCQLLIYQQTAPILVDADKRRLEFAKSCGVYYTVPADAGLVDTVASLTGGRLASGAVYVATASGNATDLPFLLTERCGKAVYFATSANKVTIDLAGALRKHLSIHCVSHGVKYLETAINLMANKAVDPTLFHGNMVTSRNLQELLSTYHVRPERDVQEVNYIDLLR